MIKKTFKQAQTNKKIQKLKRNAFKYDRKSTNQMISFLDSFEFHIINAILGKLF